MSFRTLAAVLLLAGPATAAPAIAPAVPGAIARAHLVPVSRPAPDAILAFQVSLPLRNEPGLDRLIAELNDPASPRYRHYLTPAEFTARFGPTQADDDALQRLLRAQGLVVSAGTPNRRLIEVSGPVATIERALHVTLGLYQHPAEHRLFLAPDRQPALDLPVPVLAITGLDTFTRPVSRLIRGAAAAHATGSGPNGQFIGSDMRAAYYGAGALTGAGQSVALLELGGYNIADVQHYFSTLSQPLNVPITGVSVNGASLDCSGGCDDSEQVLDMEEAIAMAPGLAHLNVYVGSNALSILNRMATDDTALQISSSWGWAANAAADEPVFKQFIAQGQSFVDATGDFGYRLALGVVWPADDALVTAVGGTDLVTAAPGGAWQSETGWADSGGGPSPNAIALPAYQKPFVTAANRGSATLRNVPDLSAEANTDNFSCYDGGCYGGNGGTSYAAPRWAGFLALANQQAAAQGKPPVGFVNAPAYRIGHSAVAYAADFHDQTSGYNGRYHDTPGFDLVTGFGSPAGQNMIDALVGR